MPLFRVFLLWAVMLAVPFQAYAAASMAFCTAQQTPTVATATPASDSAVHRHNAHGHMAADAVSDHAHDHAHGAAASMHHADHANHADGAGATHHTASHGDGDATHRCGTCGACHSVALTPAPLAVAPDFLPPADMAAPLLTVATRVPRVPDKPPRV